MKKTTAIIALIAMLVCLGLVDGYAGNLIYQDITNDARNVKLGLDLAGGVSVTYQVAGEQTPTEEDLADTQEKLQMRAESFSTEAQVYREGNDRITVEIPGETDADAVLANLGSPGSLYFIREKDNNGNDNYSQQVITNPDGSSTVGMNITRTIQEMVMDGSVVLNGSDVANASGAYQQDQVTGSNTPVVELSFTDEGTKKFAEATTAAYQAGETIGIYYDGRIISYPTVNEPITGGKAVIQGMGTIQAAQQLASMIRIGGLKVELEELRSNVVGAQLGQNAISTSLKAGALGLILVMIFMIVMYLCMGVAADLALLLYTGLIILILSGFSITLTLPGIAGILLSIGMAVDANVIIFARIREELRNGVVVRQAIKKGYSKALSSIIDGNVTTLIAAAVLAVLGSGSIRGFAITLAIGIVLSMITALFVTRFIMFIMYSLGLQDPKYYGLGKEPKTIDFIGKRKIFFALSLCIILAGFAAMGMNKANIGRSLNFSLDFVGGTSTDVTFAEKYTLEELNDKVVPVFSEITGDSDVQVQQVKDSTGDVTGEVIFKTRMLTQEERDALSDALEEQFGVDQNSLLTETISSTISSEMRRDAVIAVVVALIAMLLYIWFRFKDIRFGASSVLALAHDVLVVLACYAFLRISVGSTFIACMLTIVGYSINATIVIFDRMRENLRGNRKADLKDLVNTSVSQTLTRSLFTSLTTFFVVLALFIFGVASIRDFALPIMVGIVSGAYSSVCLAGPVWYVLRNRIGGNSENILGGKLEQEEEEIDTSAMTKEEVKALKKKKIKDKNRAKISV
ncbi:MAG: protein translocase subunit SecD [Lachnospiraceae bacterium]|nr:protein translocase subunit SecD [Lachnospiraceae bacterium]